MATPEYNEWEIEALQNRYKEIIGFEINEVQAKKIIEFEQEKNNGLGEYFFSVWEELDYKTVFHRKILTDEQFILFEKSQLEALEMHRQQLVNEDGNCLNEIEFYKEKIRYYEEQFLPDLFKDPFLFYTLGQMDGSSKIDFLKAEYKKYLSVSKRKI